LGQPFYGLQNKVSNQLVASSLIDSCLFMKQAASEKDLGVYSNYRSLALLELIHVLYYKATGTILYSHAMP